MIYESHEPHATGLSLACIPVDVRRDAAWLPHNTTDSCDDERSSTQPSVPVCSEAIDVDRRRNIRVHRHEVSQASNASDHREQQVFEELSESDHDDVFSDAASQSTSSDAEAEMRPTHQTSNSLETTCPHTFRTTLIQNYSPKTLVYQHMGNVEAHQNGLILHQLMFCNS